MDFEIEWTVSGSSTVRLSETDLRAAADAGVDLEDTDAVWEFTANAVGLDALTSDILNDWDSRDAPDIISVYGIGYGAPDWWYDEYLEYDADGEFIGFKDRTKESK